MTGDHGHGTLSTPIDLHSPIDCTCLPHVPETRDLPAYLMCIPCRVLIDWLTDGLAARIGMCSSSSRAWPERVPGWEPCTVGEQGQEALLIMDLGN